MLVFPSLIEGFGLVLLEAFEAKKPVLVSDVSPSNEIVENAIDGFILPPVDAKNWADKIFFLLQNKDVCEVMGRKGRQKVETKYDIRQIAERFETLYGNLLSSPIDGQQSSTYTSIKAFEVLNLLM
jgi:glycosyltransferase involved in cell wall biosynthesis